MIYDTIRYDRQSLTSLTLNFIILFIKENNNNNNLKADSVRPSHSIVM